MSSFISPKKMDVSIVIPTFNRTEILKECLSALNRQECGVPYEVVLVDDASTDGTLEMVEAVQKSLSFPLIFLRQAKKGPAAARNLGIKNCSGQIVLIMGDDIIAAPGLLREHLDCHTARFAGSNAAVLGFVTWSPHLKVTPCMRWLEKRGWQFPYGELVGKTEIEWKYLITANISFKKSFLVENNLFFDERFPHAALEDYEFGFRFSQKGGRLFYNPDTIGYHWHHISLDDACRRMLCVGQSARILREIAPQLRPYKIAWRKYVYTVSLLRFIVQKLLHPLARFMEEKAVWDPLFSGVLFFYFLKGLYEGEDT